MDARKKYEQQSVSLRSLAVFDSDCFLAAVKATMSDKGDKCFPEFDELLCHLDQLPVDKLDKFDEALGPPFFPHGCSKQQYYAETRRVLADTWYAKRAQANREMWEQHMDRIPPLALADMIVELIPKDLPGGFDTEVVSCFNTFQAFFKTRVPKEERLNTQVPKEERLNRLLDAVAIARANQAVTRDQFSKAKKEWKRANKQAVARYGSLSSLPLLARERRTQAYWAIKNAAKAHRLAKKAKKRAKKQLKKATREGEEK